MTPRFAALMAPLAFVGVLSGASPAHAQSTPSGEAFRTFEGRRVPAAWQLSAEAPPSVQSMEKETYVSHVLLADAVALTTLVVGLKKESGPVVAAATALYLAGGPVVHLAHGRRRTAGASFGLRVLAPLVTGALVGSAMYLVDRRDLTFVVGAGIGGTAALIAAPILDATLLARQEWFDALPVAPQISVTATGASVGLVGAF